MPFKPVAEGTLQRRIKFLIQLIIYLLIYLFRGGASLCNSICPETHYVNQAGFKFRDSPAGIKGMHYNTWVIFVCVFIFVYV